MSDPVFLVPAGRPTLAEIVAATSAEVSARADLGLHIRGVASLESADRGEIAVLDDAGFVEQLRATRAAACFVPHLYAGEVPDTCLALVTETPLRAFATLVSMLYPGSVRPGSFFATAGSSPSAIIHPEARLEPGVIVDPSVVVGPRAEIGSGSVIGAGSVIGPDVRIGRDSAIGAQVTLSHALLGNRVVLQPGVRLGQESRSLAADARGSFRLPRIGRVIVQDDVEIGANATIDRGATGDTVIGEGAKVGPLVTIAEDVMIGRHCVIGAQAGLASEARLGDFVTVGERASVARAVGVAAGQKIAPGLDVEADIEARSPAGA